MSHLRTVVFSALCTSAMVLLSAPVAQAGEPGFVQGPYLQNPTPGSMTVCWEQEVEGAAQVRVGPAGGELADVFPSPAGAGRKQVLLTGLAAGQQYEYEVAVDGGETTARAAFVTAPGGAAPFRWALYGDTRSSTVNHAAVVASIVGEGEIHFGVQTGDMVADGETASQWDDYFDIEQPLMRSVPVFPVIGNHDEVDRAADELTDRFVAPTNSPMPEHYYSFRYANAWFTVLDGHVNVLDIQDCLTERDLFVEKCMTPEQIDWVEADLEQAATTAGVDHIFVLVHIGPYSSKENRSGSMDVRRLLPTFQAMGVRAILSGHDHYYERGRSAFGVPYIISGGAGAGLYDIAEPSSAPHEVFAGESVHHHVLVEVDGPTVTFTARRSDGTVLDTHAITKEPPECTTDADCATAEPPPDCVPPGTCSVAGRCAFGCAIEGLNPFPELVEDPDEPDADASGGDTGVADEPAETAGPSPEVEVEAEGGLEEETGPASPTEPDTSSDSPPRADSGGCSGGLNHSLAWLLALALSASAARRAARSRSAARGAPERLRRRSGGREPPPTARPPLPGARPRRAGA